MTRFFAKSTIIAVISDDLTVIQVVTRHLYA